MAATDPNTQHDDGEGNMPDAGTIDPRVEAVAMAAEMSPLDASLRRGNPRQQHGAPSLFDARDPLSLPPVSFSPGVITADPNYTDNDASVCAPAVAALEALQGAITRTIEAREQLRGNIALSEGQRVLEVAAFHEKLQASALPKVDRALASLQSSIRSLETELAAPVQAAAHNAVAQEVRSYLRSLPESKRMGVVMQAINDGCVTTAGAVLAQNLPAYLTGLPADSLPTLQTQWAKKRNPQAAQRLELLRSVEAKVAAAGPQFLALIDRTIGAHHTTVSKLRAAQSQLRKVVGAVA
jgi:hypothetical protein